MFQTTNQIVLAYVGISALRFPPPLLHIQVHSKQAHLFGLPGCYWEPLGRCPNHHHSPSPWIIQLQDAGGVWGIWICLQSYSLLPFVKFLNVLYHCSMAIPGLSITCRGLEQAKVVNLSITVVPRSCEKVHVRYSMAKDMDGTRNVPKEVTADGIHEYFFIFFSSSSLPKRSSP